MVSEDLDGSIMASKLSSTEILPKIWAIEVLARSKQLNTSELIDLVRRTPELSDDIGKNAREMISLRILETLFVQGNQNNNEDASAPYQKIEFSPSNSCEDVLRHILQEMSASNVKLGASEMLRWDVRSFITHKKDSLPVVALQKLKDAIVEGSHSVFASWKERSGVTVRTQCNDNVTGDGVKNSGPGERLEERSKDTQIVAPNQNSSPNTTENRVDELQEKLPGRNSLPCKRNRSDIIAENLERETHEDQITQDNCYDPYAESAKKLKQDVHITEDAVIQKSITSATDGLLANSSERIVEHIDREGCNLENEAEIGGMEMEHNRSPHDAGNQCAAKKIKQDVNITEHAIVVKSITSAGDGLSANSSEKIAEHIDGEGCNPEREAEIVGKDIKHAGSTHDGGNQYAALKMLTWSSDVVDAGDWNCRLQTPIDDNIEVNMPEEMQDQSHYADKANGCMERFEDKASNGTSLGANEEHNSINEAIKSFHHTLQKNTSTSPEANDNVEHNQFLATASDSDEYHDESNDIALKKNAFLSSQCTFSEDSLATQPNLCMKCNNGGQLLICSSNTCPLVVHESCLGSAAKFDGEGKFYCPFCAYSRAISEYLEVKKKASLARKDLATFIGLKVGHRSKLSTGPHRSKQKQVRRVDELCENNEPNIDGDPLHEVDRTHWRSNGEDKLQAEPSRSCAGYSLPCRPNVEDKLQVEPSRSCAGDSLPCRPNVEDKLQAEPSISCAGDCLPCEETVADITHGELKALGKGNLEGERRELEHQSPIRPGEWQIEIQAPHKSDADISSHKQADLVYRHERQTVTRGKKKVTHPPESSLHSEPPCQTSCESSEEDDDKSSESKYSMRSRRPEKQYIYPSIPQLRRKRHPWTKVEEEKLKEGVQRFSSPHDLSIPWKTILEFGGDVFQKGRTTVDLKDKWRNICKAGTKSK